MLKEPKCGEGSCEVVKSVRELQRCRRRAELRNLSSRGVVADPQLCMCSNRVRPGTNLNSSANRIAAQYNLTM
jgi:hypothetical protein